MVPCSRSLTVFNQPFLWAERCICSQKPLSAPFPLNLLWCRATARPRHPISSVKVFAASCLCVFVTHTHQLGEFKCLRPTHEMNWKKFNFSVFAFHRLSVDSVSKALQPINQHYVLLPCISHWWEPSDWIHLITTWKNISSQFFAEGWAGRSASNHFSVGKVRAYPVQVARLNHLTVGRAILHAIYGIYCRWSSFKW